jgi:uncharacterized protein (DUF952 family)
VTAELFHLTDAATWSAAVAAGEYRTSTRDVTLAEQGFIHCSLRHQVRGVAQAFFAGVDDLLLLVIDADRLGVPVRFESPGPGAEEYPHIYGPLPVDAVTAVVPIGRDATGAPVLPW